MLNAIVLKREADEYSQKHYPNSPYKTMASNCYFAGATQANYVKELEKENEMLWGIISRVTEILKNTKDKLLEMEGSGLSADADFIDQQPEEGAAYLQKPEDLHQQLKKSEIF